MSLFCIVLVFINVFFWSGTARYTMEMLELDYNVTTPNNLDMNFKVIRAARGVFAVSGFLDLKEDLNTDNATFYANVYYSTNGMTYMLAPFRIRPSNMTHALNSHYKTYIMDTINECCNNPRDVNEKFVVPLAKGLLECDKCMFKADNFPTNLRLGYYKVTGIVTNEIGLAMTVIFKLDVE